MLIAVKGEQWTDQEKKLDGWHSLLSLVSKASQENIALIIVDTALIAEVVCFN
jgi:hypothetical protein